MIYQLVSLAMTVNDPLPIIQETSLFDVEYLGNLGNDTI